MTLLTIKSKSQSVYEFATGTQYCSRINFIGPQVGPNLPDSVSDMVLFDSLFRSFTSLTGRKFVKVNINFPPCGTYSLIPIKLIVKHLYLSGVKQDTINNFLNKETYVTTLRNGDYAIFTFDSCNSSGVLRFVCELEKDIPQICQVGVDVNTGKNLITIDTTDNAKFHISSYNIYRENSLNEYIKINNILSPINYYIDTVANPALQSFNYKILSIDENGDSSILSDAHSTIHLSASLGINQEINLTYNAYIGFNYISFYVFRSIDNNPYTIIDSLSSSTFSYTDFPPTYTNISYRIGVKNNSSCYLSKKNILDEYVLSNIKTPTANSVNEFGQQNNIQIYPNPTNNQIIVDFDENMIMKGYAVKITNSLGMEVYTSIINSKQSCINLSEYCVNGIYFIHILDNKGNNIAVKKIILQ